MHFNFFYVFPSDSDALQFWFFLKCLAQWLKCSTVSIIFKMPCPVKYPQIIWDQGVVDTLIMKKPKKQEFNRCISIEQAITTNRDISDHPKFLPTMIWNEVISDRKVAYMMLKKKEKGDIYQSSPVWCLRRIERSMAVKKLKDWWRWREAFVYLSKKKGVIEEMFREMGRYRHRRRRRKRVRITRTTKYVENKGENRISFFFFFNFGLYIFIYVQLDF